MRIHPAVWAAIAIVVLTIIAPKIFGSLLILLFIIGVIWLVIGGPRGGGFCRRCGRRNCGH